MTSSAILQVVAGSISMVVGAIVFMILFFRAVAWLDVWMRKRNKRLRNDNRSTKRANSRRRMVQSNDNIKSQRNASVARRPLAAKGFSGRLHDSEHYVGASKSVHENAISSNKSDIAESMENPVISFDETRLTAIDYEKPVVEFVIHLSNGEVIGPVRTAHPNDIHRHLIELGMNEQDFMVVQDRKDTIYCIRQSTVQLIVCEKSDDRSKALIKK